ncbi:MAG: hypothetical protein Ct9H300mP21_00860 [Pseudomonadota bacterium]|nr:MAG: hypothetical protein Ct9H300mP21_00860 [Pseudomonadota bacterium]
MRLMEFYLVFLGKWSELCGGSRVLLHESIHDKILGQVARRAKEIRIGDPLAETSQMGPLGTLAQLNNIQSTVADATPNGATLIHGGENLHLKRVGIANPP